MDNISQSSPQSVWRDRALALTVLVVACIGAYRIGMASRHVGDANQGLSVDGSSLDFGEVWEVRDFSWNLPVHNNTTEEVRVGEFTASCSCLSIEPRTLVIPAGQTVPIHLLLDLTTKAVPPTAQNQRNEAKSVADFAVQVAPRIANSPAPPIVWTIRGRVRKALAFSEPQLDFGESLVRGHPFQPKIIRVTAHLPLVSLHAKCNPALALVHVKASGDTKTFELEVAPRENLPLGSLAFGVKVKPNARADEHLPEFELPIVGTVVGDVRPAPISVFLGPVRLGETSGETVTLWSKSGKPFTVDSIAPSADTIHVEPCQSSPQGAKAFRITQKASRLGQQPAQIRFLVRSDLTPDTPLAFFLPVTYHGIVGKESTSTEQGVAR